MTAFFRDNWFLLFMLAICCLGHLFGHGRHHPTSKQDKPSTHEHHTHAA